MLTKSEKFTFVDTILNVTLDFEWDPEKADANFRKHGIRFDEAAHIFAGTVLTRVDTREASELREISFGLLGRMVALAVVHTDRNGRMRIISARKATAQERKLFNGHITGKVGRNRGDPGQ